MTLSEVINKYIDAGNRGVAYNLGNDFSLIRNPSFAILPSQPHRSPFVVAIYCRCGEGTGRVNARTYNIEAGGLFIVLPGQITELVALSDDFEADYLLMTGSFTESLSIGNTFDLYNIIQQHPYALLSERAREAVEDYFKMVTNLITVEANPHRAEIMRLITRAFFLGLGYFLHEQDTPDVANSRSKKLTSEFIELVEENYREHRDLKFYAERMGLTPKYISTVVKSSSDRSAVEWIERYVILDAIAQLSSTDRSIKHIAYDLNFPSVSFFGKYFTRIMGVSPSAYRQSLTKDE
ncbi:MAG: AraC family transcriptional regulator [Alistipes sp.]|nr:AraC family transcriptional regulator [Alistipes sp.]